MKSIVIPDSVTYIESEAFAYCENLESIIIPDFVKSIGEKIFCGCSSLKKIYYPFGLIGKLHEGNHAQLIPYQPNVPFLRKPSVVKLITLSSDVENLKWHVDGITLTVGGTYEITDYSKETPQWHDYLKTIQRIIIEDGVKKISANAFIDCIHLEHIKIPASVKTIGDLAFMISYCGERTANDGRNVIWSLDNGTLVLKKNPAASEESDFSIGEITWRAIEKNIKQIKIECGVMSGNSFFEWLWKSERDVQLKLI